VFWGMGLSLKTEMDTGVLESNWMLPVPRLPGKAQSGTACLAIARRGTTPMLSPQ